MLIIVGGIKLQCMHLVKQSANLSKNGSWILSFCYVYGPRCQLHRGHIFVFL